MSARRRRVSRASFGPEWSREGHPDAWTSVRGALGGRYAEQAAKRARDQRRRRVAAYGPFGLVIYDELHDAMWEEIQAVHHIVDSISERIAPDDGTLPPIGGTL